MNKMMMMMVYFRSSRSIGRVKDPDRGRGKFEVIGVPGKNIPRFPYDTGGKDGMEEKSKNQGQDGEKKEHQNRNRNQSVNQKKTICRRV